MSNEQQFHSLVAQILPVLLLAITIQSSFQADRRKRSEEDLQWHAIAILAYVFILVLGETYALLSVLFGHTLEDAYPLEALAFGTGIYLLAIDTVARIYKKMDTTSWKITPLGVFIGILWIIAR